MSRLLRPSTRRRSVLLILAASVLIALLCSIASVSRISGFPPKLERRNLQTAGAVTHVLVDLKHSGITDGSAQWPYFNRVSTRADLLAHLMASDPGLAYIGRRAGVPADQIAAIAPIGMPVAGALTEPGSEAEAHDLLLARKPYRLEVQSAQGSPVVDIYAQAPTPAEAERLANASIAGARDYFRAVSAKTTLPPVPAADPNVPVDPYASVDAHDPIRVIQLGTPRGVVLTGGADMAVAALTFLLAFGVALAGLLGLAAMRRRRRGAAAIGAGAEPSDAGLTPIRRPILTAAAARATATLPWGPPALAPGGAVALRPAWPVVARSRTATGDGDWPHTSRVLPWMLAGFMVMLWLVPFDSIKLGVPSPIDLWLDRLLLPVIVGTWALSLLVGGRAAPRLRPSRIAAAVGGFVVVAFLSVILDAGTLSHTLEFDTALKKLPLMLSYPMLFVMFASVVRRREVAPFMTFTLLLALVCALGMIWEDKFSQNLFFDWSDKVLPGVFHVASGDAGWDTMGRRFVHGPTSHPLAAAGMLSMAFPIAVLGVIHGQSTRQRILYGLAGAVLLVGVLSTQRKTGLVAPVAGLLTLAYFRRRELLRLAPLGVLGVVVLLIAAPGTAAPVINQFKPDSLSGADTVNDRASDYDAIRPDFWSHVALGRGFGTYDPVGHRILDSQVLGTLIETGAIGLVAFFLLGITVVASARRTIHARHPPWALSALAGAAAAVVFLVLAFLFDSLAFPQLPYVFMCFAGLVAVVVRTPEEDLRPAPG